MASHRARVPISPLALLIACGGGAQASGGTLPSREREPATIDVDMRIAFDVRVPTERGASRDVEVRPGAELVVVVRDAAGDEVERTTTDVDGRFRVRIAESSRVFVRAESSAEPAAVTRDAEGVQTHEFLVVDGPAARAPNAPREWVAHDEPDGAAGAIHIVETLVLGIRRAEEWSRAQLPPVFVWWMPRATTNWSFYRGERPEGSGRFALELMAPTAEHPELADTDEHDESIILHELGHFVMDALSTDSSTGGDHPPGVLVEPGLAWEEGRASWFAAAVLGVPRYIDAIGREPYGRLRVDYDIEGRQPAPGGVGSERTVVAVLWDLTDGEGPTEAPQADLDRDGVALGAAEVLRQMIALRSDPSAYPYLGSFLGALVANGTVPEREAKELLGRNGGRAIDLPSLGAPIWPRPLAVAGDASGKIDSVSTPAPSGGIPLPGSGFDSVHAYSVDVPTRGVLRIDLQIFGTGAPGDQTDVDLDVRDIRARPLGQSRGTGSHETVAIQVEPGRYIVYVRDGGGPTRAPYRVSASVTPINVGPSP